MIEMDAWLSGRPCGSSCGQQLNAGAAWAAVAAVREIERSVLVKVFMVCKIVFRYARFSRIRWRRAALRAIAVWLAADDCMSVSWRTGTCAATFMVNQSASDSNYIHLGGGVGTTKNASNGRSVLHTE